MQIGVFWLTASRIRIAMGHRDSIYHLHDLIEIDDAIVGGRRCSCKRGRGAANKSPVLVAVESRDSRAGFMPYNKCRLLPRKLWLTLCKATFRLTSRCVAMHSPHLRKSAKPSTTLPE